MSNNLERVSLITGAGECHLSYQNTSYNQIDTVSSTNIFSTLSNFIAKVKPSKIRKVIVCVGPGKLILQRNTIVAAKVLSRYYDGDLLPFSLFDVVRVDNQFRERKKFYVCTVAGTSRLLYFIYCCENHVLSEISTITSEDLSALKCDKFDLMKYSLEKMSRMMINAEANNIYYRYRFSEFSGDNAKPPRPLNLTLLTKVI